MLGKDKWLDIGRVFDHIYSSSVSQHLSPIYWLNISWYVGQVSALYQLSFIRFTADKSADGWVSVENQSSVGCVLVGYRKSIGQYISQQLCQSSLLTAEYRSICWLRSVLVESKLSSGWYSTLSTMDWCSPNTWLTLGQYWPCICRVLVDILAHRVGWHYLASMIQAFQPLESNLSYYHH